jgi:hypothetical protein
MAKRLIDVFFYGLFMDAELLRSEGTFPQNVRRAAVPRDGNSCAHGILLELSHDDIEKLYSDESVRAYRQEAVLTKLDDGSVVPALCFNLIDSPHSSERNAEYAAKLRALARRLELPADYVESI